ncbi:MAG: hypothetical protein K0U34_05810 [Alphaproteobacteria bacterium]|nr:hypothetical protein [Alphaproteobacteria bacterium]
MCFADYTKRLLGLAETLHRWIDLLSGLDCKRKAKVAVYADQVADTLARAVAAIERLCQQPDSLTARRQILREFGRISGYVETIVETLTNYLDGRKLAGVKRRLDQLESLGPDDSLDPAAAGRRLDRLVSCEGYFRALADALRA